MRFVVKLKELQPSKENLVLAVVHSISPLLVGLFVREVRVSLGGGVRPGVVVT